MGLRACVCGEFDILAAEESLLPFSLAQLPTSTPGVKTGGFLLGHARFLHEREYKRRFFRRDHKTVNR